MPRRGLSEVVGATIIIMVVMASILLYSHIVSREARKTLEVIEAASTWEARGPPIIMPLVESGSLYVYFSPSKPDETYTLIILDYNNTLYGLKRITANSTNIMVKVIDTYDCRPVYIIVMDSNNIYIYNNLRDPRVIERPGNPFIFSCRLLSNPSEDSGRNLLLPPGTIVIPLNYKSKTVRIQLNNYPNITVEGKAYLVRLSWNDGILYACKGSFNVTIDDQLVVQDYKIYRCGQHINILNSSNINISLVFDRPPEGEGILGYLRITGYSDYYILWIDAKTFGRISSASNPLLPLLTLNDTVVVYPVAVAYNASGGAWLRITGSIYYATSRARGVFLTTGIIPLIYSTAKRYSFYTDIKLNITVLSEFNVTEVGEPLTSIPLGDVAPGTPVNITIRPLKACRNENRTMLLNGILGLWSLPSIKLVVAGSSTASIYKLVLGENIIIPKVSGEARLIIYDIPLEVPSPWMFKTKRFVKLDRRLEGVPIYSGGVLGCAVSPLLVDISVENRSEHLLLWPAPSALHDLLESLDAEAALARNPIAAEYLAPYGYTVFSLNGDHARLIAAAGTWDPATPTGPLIWVGVWSLDEAFTLNLVNGTSVVKVVRIPLYTSLYGTTRPD